MRRMMAFWLVCATACAASSQSPPAPSSLWVEPERDVRLVADECPPYTGWYCMTADAVRQDELNRVEAETRLRGEVVDERGRRELAERQRDDARRDADRNDSWARWGPLGIATAFVVGVVGGTALGAALGGQANGH